MSSVKFSLFSDLHYIKEYYSCTPKHLEAILQRAADNDVDFVMSLGDFSNDYIGSPEMISLYLDNPHGFPVYGIYGNHELECMHHGKADLEIAESMIYVTPYLTNRADEVHWGTADGKPSPDGSIAYYWFEKNGFRFICTDCGYSYNKTTGEWEHNRDLYVRTKGNSPTECIGEPQRRWMENVLTEAAHNDIPCIVFTHPTLYRAWGGAAGDAEDTRELFRRVNAIRKGTVVAAINGHLHTDHAAVEDNIVFLDINVVINGFWKGDGEPHYSEGQTFEYPKYDAKGQYLGTETKEIRKLHASGKTWFFKDPLNCIVKITNTGKSILISVDGAETEYLYGVLPPVDKPPRISSRSYMISR